MCNGDIHPSMGLHPACAFGMKGVSSSKQISKLRSRRDWATVRWSIRLWASVLHPIMEHESMCSRVVSLLQSVAWKGPPIVSGQS